MDNHNLPGLSNAVRISKKLIRVLEFLPLLLLYIFVILLTSTNNFQGDEGIYLWFANNLSHGYYSPQDDINLLVGPGYPILLLPFALLKLPWLTARLMNALLLFMAILYFYYTLRLYVQERTALYLSFLLGIYPPFWRHIHLLYTETLVIFLVCGFLFHFCKVYRNPKRPWLALLFASFYLGYLALTKIFFGYVILIGLLLFLALYLWQKANALKKILLIYSFAFIFCLPYLFYTYSLTDKIFYWGNSGGMSLYWMSTPYQSEFGDWHSAERVREIPGLSKNHQDLFDELVKLPNIQRDDEFKRLAIDHIIHNPIKFFQNWLANIGRLLFNYPYSYTSQKLSTYFYIVPNMFLIVLSVLCIYPSYLGRRLIPFEIFALILFDLISFEGTSLLSAYSRQFIPLVPVLVLWVSFTVARIVKVEIQQ